MWQGAPPANDPAEAAAPAVSRSWYPATQRPPHGRDILIWVHGPFVGRYDAVRECWLANNGGQLLEPVSFWAEIVGPDRRG